MTPEFFLSQTINDNIKKNKPFFPGALCFDLDCTLLEYSLDDDVKQYPSAQQQKECNITIDPHPINGHPLFWLARREICEQILLAYRLGIPVVFITHGTYERKIILERLEQDQALEELQNKLATDEENFIYLNRDNLDFRIGLLQDQKCIAPFLEAFATNNYQDITYTSLHALSDNESVPSANNYYKIYLKYLYETMPDNSIDWLNYAVELLKKTNTGKITGNNKGTIIGDYFAAQGYTIDPSKICLVDDIVTQRDSCHDNYYCSQQNMQAIQADIVLDGGTPRKQYNKNYTHVQNINKFLYSCLATHAGKDFYSAIQTLATKKQALAATTTANYPPWVKLELDAKILYLQTQLTQKMLAVKQRYYAVLANNNTMQHNSSPVTTSGSSSSTALHSTAAITAELQNLSSECHDFTVQCDTELNSVTTAWQKAQAAVASREMQYLSDILLTTQPQNTLRQSFAAFINAIKNRIVELAFHDLNTTKQRYTQLCSNFFTKDFCECMFKLSQKIYDLKYRCWGKDQNAAENLTYYMEEAIIKKMTTYVINFLSAPKNNFDLDYLEEIAKATKSKILNSHRHYVAFRDSYCCANSPTATVTLLHKLLNLCTKNNAKLLSYDSSKTVTINSQISMRQEVKSESDIEFTKIKIGGFSQQCQL